MQHPLASSKQRMVLRFETLTAARDRKFEYSSLQRRVCKPSVPQRPEPINAAGIFTERGVGRPSWTLAWRHTGLFRWRLEYPELKRAAWGLSGGRPGGRDAFRFGNGVEPFTRGNGRLRPGGTVEIITPGAGGYGPP